MSELYEAIKGVDIKDLAKTMDGFLKEHPDYSSEETSRGLELYAQNSDLDYSSLMGRLANSLHFSGIVRRKLLGENLPDDFYSLLDMAGHV